MTKSLSEKNIVVYADDDTDDQAFVREAFSRYTNNVELMLFRDGREVLSYLHDIGNNDPAPCLVILDINMPGINGKEVLVRLRQMEKFHSVPVVLFSTSNQPLDKQFAARYYAGFITKPLEVKQMKNITEQFIDHCTEEMQKKIRRQML
ncbi:MAG: response regulator [Flavisolibacter sp.]|nr:response regulator [Flavisolibacter sp.]MBD0284694.1 response regulator [Flavisolibacter sp.]MBD0364550.1 response regulator [Flavisolibacter sp.]MBD0374937.1 response regulator [Flavisolibacter sp.]